MTVAEAQGKVNLFKSKIIDEKNVFYMENKDL